MASALLVIAPSVFRDEEYALPKEVLEAAGVSVVTASTEPGACTGKLGMQAIAEIGLAEAEPSEYDAVAFIGGAGASVFFDDPAAHHIARAAHANGAVLAAICIGPSVLARAGLLHNVRATSFASQRTDLEAHGGLFTGAPVEVDGRIVTANGPDAARAFGEAIAARLSDTDLEREGGTS